MDVQAELKSFKTRLDPMISAYFDTAIEHGGREDPLVEEAVRHAREMILAGGKRLRAAFMYFGYLAAHGREEQKILETAISIELIHAFLLVHDDIIDRDDIRHGVPTLHRRYADFGKRYFPEKDADHFGVSIALIMGDMLSSFGNDIIFRSGFPPERVFRALSQLQGIVSYTVIGQARDVYMEYARKATEQEIITMYKNKTAKYTVEGPLQLGAILAGADEKLLDMLSKYAIPLGIAFQIQDDILGIFGTAERLGKPVGSDIEEGKITILVSRAFQKGSAQQQKRITEILALGTALTHADIEEFRQILIDTGAAEESKKLAGEYIKEGKRALSQLEAELDPRAYDFLDSIAEYMLDREY